MATSSGKLVKSPDELRKALKEGHNNFFIKLNYGIKSSKHITEYITNKRKQHKFEVFNESDGTTQSLSEKQLLDINYTNIGIAMKKKAFYVDED